MLAEQSADGCAVGAAATTTTRIHLPAAAEKPSLLAESTHTTTGPPGPPGPGRLAEPCPPVGQDRQIRLSPPKPSGREALANGSLQQERIGGATDPDETARFGCAPRQARRGFLALAVRGLAGQIGLLESACRQALANCVQKTGRKLLAAPAISAAAAGAPGPGAFEAFGWPLLGGAPEP